MQTPTARQLTEFQADGLMGYAIINGWLVQEAEGCTCHGVGGHEPGCGYEPLVKVADFAESGIVVVERERLEAHIRASIRAGLMVDGPNALFNEGCDVAAKQAVDMALEES